MMRVTNFFRRFCLTKWKELGDYLEGESTIENSTIVVNLHQHVTRMISYLSRPVAPLAENSLRHLVNSGSDIYAAFILEHPNVEWSDISADDAYILVI